MSDELAALRLAAKTDERASKVLIDYLMQHRQRWHGRRGYTVTKYPGMVDSLTIGAVYFVLPDGRVARGPTSRKHREMHGANLQAIGVALSRTTIAVDGRMFVDGWIEVP